MTGGDLILNNAATNFSGAVSISLRPHLDDQQIAAAWFEYVLLANVNLNGILIGSEDPARLVDYYTKLFGDPAMSEGGYTVWQLGSGYVTVGPHSEVSGKSAQPGRISGTSRPLMSRTTSALQGRRRNRRREPYGMDEASDDGLIATFADPDGNYFQLMSPMPADMGS